MSWNEGIRQVHRWVSLAFTATVIANFVALAQVDGMPPPWVTYSPLPPLALLLFTGLYLFVLPYASGRRGGRRADPSRTPEAR
ncbi:MAG: hypothetical protein U0790_08015 [Isosphaeraceae bacterium]